MASIQERLQIKRVPIDKWSVREQLYLASAVGRSGDQNWMSVSRSLKTCGDPNRPADWFSQKNCAAQYGSLLENVETPKRKKRTSSGGAEAVVETPGESILRKLTHERVQELKAIMDAKKKEYARVKEEIEALDSGKASDEQVDEWKRQYDEEERQKEKDVIAHALWLKEREQRKQEVERAWRPTVTTTPTGKSQAASLGFVTPKRKASELDGSDLDASADADALEPAKPALSPLLTSLLKSPSPASSVATSILHSAITRPTPTIASLLNSSTNVSVSPGLQQLVTTAIGQEPTTTVPAAAAAAAAVQQAQTLVEVKLEPDCDIEIEENPVEASSDISPKIEEILSEATMDLNLPTPTSETNAQSELDEDSAEATARNETATPDAFETSGGISSMEAAENSSSGTPGGADDGTKSKDSSPTEDTDSIFVENDEMSSDSAPASDAHHQQQQQRIKPEESTENASVELPGKIIKTEAGSVEIVEVKVEDEDSDKELYHPMNEITTTDSVHTHEDKPTAQMHVEETSTPTLPDSSPDDSEKDASEKSPETMGTTEDSAPEDSAPDKIDVKEEKEASRIDIDVSESSNVRRSTFSPEYTEAFFDDMTIEVTKLDKSGRAKRDYSRTKKKEDKEFDILLAVEKAVSSQLDESMSALNEETSSEKDFQESKKQGETSGKPRIKLESSERSNSPWTEEDEVRTRRRYSTPATPIDSVPNSPASSYFDDDRDYRKWKKNAMLTHSRLAAHKCASMFQKPITDEQAPNYHSLIYRPMDLQTIRKNIESGVIRTNAEFKRDVQLMFSNAIMYNKTNSIVYDMAKQMQQESLQQLQQFVQAQKEGETPVRRETRTSEPGLKRKRGQQEEASVPRAKKRREDLV